MTTYWVEINRDYFILSGLINREEYNGFGPELRFDLKTKLWSLYDKIPPEQEKVIIYDSHYKDIILDLAKTRYQVKGQWQYENIPTIKDRWSETKITISEGQAPALEQSTNLLLLLS